jgi:hypothetical protein
MQQSLFADTHMAVTDPISTWRNTDARWRAAHLAALALAGAAFLAAVAALALVLLR